MTEFELWKYIVDVIRISVGWEQNGCRTYGARMHRKTYTDLWGMIPESSPDAWKVEEVWAKIELEWKDMFRSKMETGSIQHWPVICVSKHCKCSPRSGIDWRIKQTPRQGSYRTSWQHHEVKAKSRWYTVLYLGSILWILDWCNKIDSTSRIYCGYEFYYFYFYKRYCFSNL